MAIENPLGEHWLRRVKFIDEWVFSVYMKFLIILKRKRITLSWRSQTDTRLNQVIKVNITSNGTNQNGATCYEQNTTFLCDFSAKDIKPRSNHEKHQGNPNWKDILQNNWPVVFKSVKIMNVKGIIEELTQFGRS